MLQTNNLSVGYSPRRSKTAVLERLNLVVKSGELVCLLGANGSGKSTLLRTLAGIQPSLGGSVEIDSVDVGRLAPRDLARRIGVVLTERPLVGALPAFKLVELGRYPHLNWLGQLRPHDREVVDWAIHAVRAQDLASRDTNKLSDGERQRFMIARALAQEPSILLLDEPTAFLDVSARVELMGLLRRLAREEELAVVVSTHDLELALRMADTLWLLGPGGVVHCGAPEDLVVEGRVAEAFPAETIHFDAEDRVFRPVTEASGKATVEGDALSVQLASTVLEREGFRIVGEDNQALRVSIAEGCAWQIQSTDDSQRGVGFAALAAAVRQAASKRPGAPATR